MTQTETNNTTERYGTFAAAATAAKDATVTSTTKPYDSVVASSFSLTSATRWRMRGWPEYTTDFVALSVSRKDSPLATYHYEYHQALMFCLSANVSKGSTGS